MARRKTYQENFITGVRTLMANRAEIDTLQKAAYFLDMGYMALYKVMDGTNNPTTELCITLCRKAGYSANWMFLSEGEMFQEEQAVLNDIAKQIRIIRSRMELSSGKPFPILSNKKSNRKRTSAHK